MKILVVDDDEDYATELCKWLQDNGYEAFAALSETQARGVLADKAAEIDIAVVDMAMGSANSGLKIIEEIKSKFAWIVTLVVTGLPDVRNAARCMEAGAFSYIRKSDDPPEAILQTIKRAERQRRFIAVLPRVSGGIAQLLEHLHHLAADIEDLSALLMRLEDELHRLTDQRTAGTPSYPEPSA